MKIELIPPVIKNQFKNLLTPLIRVLVRLKLNPNWLTTCSFFVSIFAAIAFGRGELVRGAVLLLLTGFLDMLDGAVARASNRVTKFGALYDSTLDRYAEIMVFFGIAYYFVNETSHGAEYGLLVSMIVFVGIAGSLMVSYVRARAEGLGLECRVGLMQRPERLIAISIGALVSDAWLVGALLLIAVFANFTAIQRIVYIWLAENADKWKKLPADTDHDV